VSVTSSASRDGRELFIKIKGRFDFSIHQLFREAYNKDDVQNSSYQIDLSETEYIDSAALGMLLLLRERAGGDNAKIRIAGCSEDVQRILEVSNFHQMFEIEGDVSSP